MNKLEKLNVGTSIRDADTIPLARFLTEAVGLSYNVIRTDSWASRIKNADLSAADMLVRSDYDAYAYYMKTGSIAFVSIGYGSANISVAADNEDHANEMMDFLTDKVPVFEEESKDKVSVSFWSHGEHGGQAMIRSLMVPTWQDLSLNYPEATHEQLSKYINPKFRPDRGGQLMLWHGVPGTGKTTALRAMGNEWRDWCDIHYITDPEKFFGSHADYMMQILMGTGDIDGDDEFTYSSPGRKKKEEKKEPRWRLLVLEDCGELLSTDARTLSGQGLSRFLNAVDGLVGQGLRFLVLVTTNEELGELHEAVRRPGRCLSQIEFPKLNQEEARAWLEAKNVAGATIPKTATIADLYAEAEHFETRPKQKVVGFGFGG